jgi:hypothetical protein
VKLLLQVLAEEEAVESVFVYPAPGGDEAVSRMVEDQPQSLDETAYAPAYAARQVEIPAEPSGGSQGPAPDSVSSHAPDVVMDEAVVENRPEMAAVDFASSEAAGEVESETRAQPPAADFASSNAIEEAGIEVRKEMADVYFTSSETPGEVMAGGRMGMGGPGLAAPNMLGAIEAESRTEMTTTDFTSSEGVDEGRDKAGVESQTEKVGAETKITREKLEN